MNFFILGLPRSRTAWLANFMTYDEFYCYHEGINSCSSIDDYKTKLGSSGGDSTTAIMEVDITKYFPTSRKVIIDSSITAAVAYGKEHFGIDTTELLLQTKEKLDEMHGLHVPLENIDSELETIWAYLTNDIQFDAKRAELLLSLDIKTKEPYHFDIEAAKKLLWSLNEQAL